MFKKISSSLASVLLLLLAINLAWELPANAEIINSSSSLGSLIISKYRPRPTYFLPSDS